jgi:nucleoside-diphosphate-sugar epimerase
MQFFVNSFRFDGRAAREAIGYQPKIGFEEGARRTLAWYQGANLL